MIFWGLAGLLTALTVVLLVQPLGRSRLSLSIMLGLPLLAAGLYLVLGRPELSDRSSRPPLPPVLAGSVARLEEVTKTDPGDVFSWQLLGQVYGKLERGPQAIVAYRQAVAHAPERADLQLALATAIVQAANGKVTSEAQAIFQQHPADLLSRYYLALARAQAGDWEAAQAEWQELQRATPAESPLGQHLDERLAEAQRALADE